MLLQFPELYTHFKKSCVTKDFFCAWLGLFNLLLESLLRVGLGAFRGRWNGSIFWINVIGDGFKCLNVLFLILFMTVTDEVVEFDGIGVDAMTCIRNTL